MSVLPAQLRAPHPQSWYAASAGTTYFPCFSGDIDCDVCVIGGGYTGLSTALHLAEAGVDVVLLEAARVGHGASGRNGGQLHSGQRLEQDELERLAPGDARALWDLAEAGKALVHDLIARHGIDAVWRPGMVFAARSPAEAEAAARGADHLRSRYGYEAIAPLSRSELSDILPSKAFHGGTIDEGAGHLHPLRFAQGLARAAAAAGARIYENSPLTAPPPPAGGTLEVGPHKLRAQQVVLAVNGYLGGLSPAISARVLPINNYMAATAPLPDPDRVLARDVAVYDSRFVVNYWRLSEDARLIYGGGESYGARLPRDIAGTVRRNMLRYYPHLAQTPIDYAWGGTLAITASRLPYLARPGPGLWSAGGFSGHGLAIAPLAGRLMAEAIRGESAGFDLMARQPVPPFPGGERLGPALLGLAVWWFGLRDRLGI